MSIQDMKTLVFLGYKEDYEQVEIQRLSKIYDTHHIEVRKFTKRIISNLFFFNKRIQHWFYSKIIEKKINNLNNINCMFITDSIKHIRATKNVKARKVITFRNIFNGSFLDELEGFEVYSFDKSDCLNYGFHPITLPAPSLYSLENIELKQEYDISFVGLDKGRASLLNAIKTSLLDCDIHCNISIINNGKQLSYENYLQKLLNAKAVLEITIDGQSASTMRVVEALHAQRKVITNNPSIKKHPLYHPDNILFFKDIDELKNGVVQFLNTPLKKSHCNTEVYKVENIYEQLINLPKEKYSIRRL